MELCFFAWILANKHSPVIDINEVLSQEYQTGGPQVECVTHRPRPHHLHKWGKCRKTLHDGNMSLPWVWHQCFKWMQLYFLQAIKSLPWSFCSSPDFSKVLSKLAKLQFLQLWPFGGVEAQGWGRPLESFEFFSRNVIWRTGLKWFMNQMNWSSA